MSQTWENGKTPSFRPNLGLFWLKSGPPIFFVGFTSTWCYALLQAIVVCNFKENKWTKLEKIAKKLVSDQILVPLAQIWAPNFFVESTSNKC